MLHGLYGDLLNPDDFYKGKKVFITGHTGFKGSWMCQVLDRLGAKVAGYSLEPPTKPNLYTITGVSVDKNYCPCDIRSLETITESIMDFEPDIVIHMAAQPLVSVGYDDPVLTYSSNVMGTVNILEASRNCPSIGSFINVTTDKVYRNNEWEWGYRENEVLNGYDPYSNSKSCSELVTECYNKSIIKGKMAISTVRAGNVIGGGDFTNPRIIPDCVRAALEKRTMILRNPCSTRPYQHVLEPVLAYLMIAARQYEDKSLAGSYNIGPAEEGCINNESLVKLFSQYWGPDFRYEVHHDQNKPHEANYLKLDCSKVKHTFGWKPKWTVSEAVFRTVEWTKAYIDGNHAKCICNQIDRYLEELEW
jgi:CDP-glucose 4,6-dehydratase